MARTLRLETALDGREETVSRVLDVFLPDEGKEFRIVLLVRLTDGPTETTVVDVEKTG